MKKFILYFVSAVMVFFTANSAFSLPNFWYSGVAYTTAGQISPNSVLEVSITITDGTNSYHEEYLESPGVGTVSSDAFGVFSVNVGNGGSVSGNLSTLPMLASTKITVRVRPIGGTWLTVTGQALINNYLNSYVTPGGIDGNDILDGSITNVDISSSAAIGVTKLEAGSNGQVLLNNNGTNEWGTLAAGNVSFAPTGTISATNVQDAIAEVSGDVAGLKTLTNGNIYVGNSSNVATSVAMSGDVTIDNTGATTIGASKVLTGMIADGTIVNEDISQTAAISGSKINPDFGSQNITTSGNITTTGSGALTIAGTTTLSGMTTSGIVMNDANGVLSTSTVLPDGTTATTQSATDNSDKIATTQYVQSAVSASTTSLGSSKIITYGADDNLSAEEVLTAGDGISLTGNEGAGTMTVAAKLDGNTLSSSANGISINTANPNTWTAAQTFTGPTNIGSTLTMGSEDISSGTLTNATKSFIKYSGGATLNAALDFPNVQDGTIIQIFNSSTTYALLIDNLIGTQVLITLNPSDMASFVKISSGKWALLQ